MPPDPPRGLGLRPSVFQGTCLLTSQCPSTSKVNENPVRLIKRVYIDFTLNQLMENCHFFREESIKKYAGQSDPVDVMGFLRRDKDMFKAKH